MSEIVVGIDGSPCSVTALEWAVREARLRHESVRAVLTWAIDGRSAMLEATAGREESDAESAAGHLLHATVTPVADRNPDVKIDERLLHRAPVAGLAEDAEYASLLVVGARGLGPLRRLLVGSVSAGCARKSRVPVVVVRSPSGADPRPSADPRPGDGGGGPPTGPVPPTGTVLPTGPVPPIVVGVDGSDASLVALAWAAEEAAVRGAGLNVIHAWSVPALAYASGYYGPPRSEIEEAEQSVLDGAVAGALGTAPVVAVAPRLIAGRAAHILVEAAAGAALLVVGARGHGGFAGLTLGSTSHECVLHAPGPVAVIRTPARAAAGT